jgi:hypothetical protein
MYMPVTPRVHALQASEPLEVLTVCGHLGSGSADPLKVVDSFRLGALAPAHPLGTGFNSHAGSRLARAFLNLVP